VTLPPAYAWLTREPGPNLLREALKRYGVAEVPGLANSPAIMAWAKDVGLTAAYTADSVAWCGLFMAEICKAAGKPVVRDPLWARNWLKWGQEGGQPELGDVLVFQRVGGGGHVGLYVGEDAGAYHVLGGNTSDAVSIARLAKDRLLGCRQFFATGKPANVRPIVLKASGGLSLNEA
jgi:uncharacterized protein (TIGR02594 family)